MEGVDLVYTLAIVETWLTCTLISVYVAEDTLIPCNPTDARAQKSQIVVLFLSSHHIIILQVTLSLSKQYNQ